MADDHLKSHKLTAEGLVTQGKSIGLLDEITEKLIVRTEQLQAEIDQLTARVKELEARG